MPEAVKVSLRGVSRVFTASDGSKVYYIASVSSTVITLTSNQHSKLGRASNIIVEIQTTRIEDRRKLAPLGTLFEVASMVYLDSLVPTLMSKLVQTEASMRKRHAIWV